MRHRHRRVECSRASHSAGMPCLLTAKLNKAPSATAPLPTLRKPTGVSVRRRSTRATKPPLFVTLSSVASTYNRTFLVLWLVYAG